MQNHVQRLQGPLIRDMAAAVTCACTCIKASLAHHATNLGALPEYFSDAPGGPSVDTDTGDVDANLESLLADLAMSADDWSLMLHRNDPMQPVGFDLEGQISLGAETTVEKLKVKAEHSSTLSSCKALWTLFSP